MLACPFLDIARQQASTEQANVTLEVQE